MILVRLCICGPVVYAGLLTAIDPVKTLTLLNRAAYYVRWNEHNRNRQEPLWQEPVGAPDLARHSLAVQTVATFAGLAFAVFGLLGIADLAN